MTAARQTSFLEALWIPVKDGNDTGRAIFDQHYSRYHYADGRKPLLYVGPGQKLVLITPDALALFIWRKFRSMDHQEGVCCAAFRNEGETRSSFLIQAAVNIAWERWPGERLYTYVDPIRVRHKRDPGRCFLRAGWVHAGWSNGGLRILECVPRCDNRPMTEKTAETTPAAGMSDVQLETAFSYHAPTPAQTERYNTIRREAKALARNILLACPESREKSLALTNLQQCVMWAQQAIAVNEETMPKTRGGGAA